MGRRHPEAARAGKPRCPEQGELEAGTDPSLGCRSRRGSFARALHSVAESSWREEYRFRRVDDSSILVEDCGYFLRESNGRAYRIVGSMRDVTTLKGLLEREKDARAEAERASRAKDEFPGDAGARAGQAIPWRRS